MGTPEPPPQEPPPTTDPPEDTEKPGTSTTTGGTSGGGSSEPAVDPVVARKVAMFQTIYSQLWGEPASEAYLKQAANSGMNSWEFARQERNKPAWADTDVYKKKADELATMLANLGVA